MEKLEKNDRMGQMNDPVRIITHSGTFHLDEILAVATLEIFLDGKPYELIRTRDEAVVNTGDFVVDVGSQYDPSRGRFDHHQHGGAGVRPNGIPYSAFGLVWKTYGERVCGSKQVADAIDQKIGNPVDMGDNGVDYYKLVRQDTEPLLLQFVVAMFRPTWKSQVKHDDRFKELVVFARRMLELAIETERDRIEGGVIVRKAYEASEDKQIVILDAALPWGEVLAEHPEPIYVVKPKTQSPLWEVECVRDNPYGFENRKKLPSSWAGKFDGELSEVTGVSDAVFCHNMRYIAVARSREGALTLAKLALANNEE